jgi:hypothetical protein
VVHAQILKTQKFNIAIFVSFCLRKIILALHALKLLIQIVINQMRSNKSKLIVQYVNLKYFLNVLSLVRVVKRYHVCITVSQLRARMFAKGVDIINLII